MDFRGYLVAEAFENFPPVIHWCQVKKAHKGQGVASALLEQFFLDFNLGTPDAVIYTFSSYDMKRRPWVRKWFYDRKIRLVYLPDMKTTLNRPDWEA
jgi:GNAT superfamily N-acetyltransferase